jgi:hypothetical protein
MCPSPIPQPSYHLVVPVIARWSSEARPTARRTAVWRPHPILHAPPSPHVGKQAARNTGRLAIGVILLQL